MADKKVTAVTSACTLYDGELHRSSENFSLKNFEREADLFFRAYYDYGTAQQTEATEVMFDIWYDEPMRRDPVYLRDIRSGFAAENTAHPALFIANPRGAKKEFTVVAEYGLRVDSQSAIMDDHKHRSSYNFSSTALPRGYLQFHLFYHYGTMAQTAAPGVTFSVRQSRLMHTPVTVWTGVTDGTIVRNPELEKLYFADPENAAEPFTAIITMA